jgi:dephospho-CoA kinase
MTRIGITGGIGSGKTYVCQLLKQRGIPVYHCDDEAKRLMAESPVIRKKLCKLIGQDAYKGQELNKPFIAQYLFANDDHAKCVNAIVHPVVRQDFLQWIKQQDSHIVAQECALLFESGFQDMVDFTIEVYAPQPLRIQRATQRDHVAQEQIQARMAQQMNEEEKRQRADFCILNDGTTDLDAQLDLLLTQLNNDITQKINNKQND